MTQSIDTVKTKLNALLARAQRAQGLLAALGSRQAELTNQVSQAKARQALQEEMQQVLQLLQDRAHERSVGAFERLLTAIYNDVTPDGGRVRLGLTIKNNAPALDVLIQRGDKIEDVYQDNGGGVTNVVCAGLRFAALSRTKNRRFMVLDEPDGWLGENDVSPFVKVLADVSAATKTQTIFISHRPTFHFDGFANIIELRNGADGHPQAVLMQPTVARWKNDDEPGIRAIELFNVRRHRHTLIPLPPGATALVGDINTGKSTAVIGAMKAIAYGESSDSIISHDATEAKIVLYIEKKQRLVWTRKPGRNPVVQYELYAEGSDTPIEKSGLKARNEAPGWVQQLLGITRVDDLDIQLGHQKQPVFLLNDTASRRAQILSVGRESSYLPKLMKAYESVKDEDRDTVRTGEAELMRLNYRLQAVGMLEPVHQALDDFAVRFEKAEAMLRRAELLGGVVSGMSSCIARLSALSDPALDTPVVTLPKLPDSTALGGLLTQLEAVTEKVSALSKVPDLVALQPLPDMPGLGSLVEQMATATRRVSALEVIPEIARLPVLPDSSELRVMGSAIKRSLDLLSALSQVPDKLSDLPKLPEVSEINTLLAAMTKQTTELSRLASDWSSSEAELEKLTAEKAALVDECGGLCPLCGHDLEVSITHVHGV